MFWAPSYHHHHPVGGASIGHAGWTLPSGAADLASQHPTPWPMVPPRFDMPALIRTDGAAYAPADAVAFVQHAECRRLNEAPCPSADVDRHIKREPATPEPAEPERVQTIRVKDNMIDDEPADYSGLQLLSDSIERFVSRDHSPPPQATPDAATGNALDVLCAAALGQQSPPSAQVATESDLAAPAAPAFGTSLAELDFRSKLAELQRMYREKQQILKNLSKS